MALWNYLEMVSNIVFNIHRETAKEWVERMYKNRAKYEKKKLVTEMKRAHTEECLNRVKAMIKIIRMIKNDDDETDFHDESNVNNRLLPKQWYEINLLYETLRKT